MKKLNKILISAIIAGTLIFGSNLFGQEKNQAKEMASKLQQKVLLSDKQSEKVETLINNYFTDSANNEKLRNGVNAILDEKQAAKFDIIKDDWLKDVEKAKQKIK